MESSLVLSLWTCIYTQRTLELKESENDQFQICALEGNLKVFKQGITICSLYDIVSLGLHIIKSKKSIEGKIKLLEMVNSKEAEVSSPYSRASWTTENIEKAIREGSYISRLLKKEQKRKTMDQECAHTKHASMVY